MHKLDLLRWLGQEDFSQYGECYGAALDELVSDGLVQIHPNGEKQYFIAKGDGDMFRAVSLTDAGWLRLREIEAATWKHKATHQGFK